jgi:hypothetical protein
MDGGMKSDGTRSLGLDLAASTASEGTEPIGGPPGPSDSESKGVPTGPDSGRLGAGASQTTAEIVFITPERGLGLGLEIGGLEGGCDGKVGGSGSKSFPISKRSLSSHERTLVGAPVGLSADWEPGDLVPNTPVLKKSITSSVHLRLSGCRSSFR